MRAQIRAISLRGLLSGALKSRFSSHEKLPSLNKTACPEFL